MNFDLKDFPNKLAPVLVYLRRYRTIIFIVIVVLTYSILVVRINTLSRTEPSQADIDEQLKTVQRPKIDPAALKKIQQLQDQNVEVKTLFDQARENPFSE